MKKKLRRLKNILRSYKGLILAFSGGVDSSLLMSIAARVLKDRLLCVTAASPLYPKEEIELARRLARKLKVKHQIIHTDELANKNFIKNTPRRCYFCKKELFSQLKAIARPYGYEAADATNYTDRKDFRPGTLAARELGVKSPLAEARFTKKEIRELAKSLGLPNWQKPAMACLASRIPYGRKIDLVTLKKIAKGERLLKRLGFDQFRVRHHDTVVRIEVSANQLPLVLRKRNKIIKFFEHLGYQYVTLDLAGYVTGSMNKPLRHSFK